MLLHLIRHGHALPADEDAARPLSPRGRADVTALATRLRADGLAPSAIWHSPLRRARETAALLAQHAQSAGEPIMLIGKSHLQPEDDPAKIAHLLAELPPRANLAIVGHEPHLSALAALLATGRAEPPRFAFETAGLLSFVPAEGKHEASGLPRWEARDGQPPAPERKTL